MNTEKGRKGFQKRPLEERFWEKVERAGEDECWLWRGSTAGPYGIIWVDGRSRRAAQVVWELTHGKPFPSGMYACHHCDNPPCVNPRHIFAGTPKDNIQDSLQKGRQIHDGRKKQKACANGHPFTPENTYIRPSTGYRECRTCRREWSAANQAALTTPDTQEPK